MNRALAALTLFSITLLGCSGGSGSTAAPSSTSAPEASATAAATEVPVPTSAPTEAPPEPTATSTIPANLPPSPTVAAPAIQPSPVPPPPPTAAPQAQTPPPPVSFNIVASLLQFNTRQLSARSGAAVSVSFTNQDTGVAHDISFSIAGLGHGHTCFGPCSDSYSFTAPAPGQYPFFCTVHAEMQGTFTVTP